MADKPTSLSDDDLGLVTGGSGGPLDGTIPLQPADPDSLAGTAPLWNVPFTAIPGLGGHVSAPLIASFIQPGPFGSPAPSIADIMRLLPNFSPNRDYPSAGD